MFEELSQEQLQGYIDQAVGLFMEWIPQVLLALLVLFIGLWVIRRIVRVIELALTRGPADETLTKFLTSLASIALKVLLFISVASMVGIATTSFVAILGAAGLAVGLALQGSLANFAGGVLILIFRPFKIGDYIEGEGASGTVREIRIFSTILSTPDNKRIIVPNGPLSNNSITNFSTEATRRVDFVFGIGYDDDLKKAKEILERLVTSDERVLKDPAHLVVVSELADSSVNFTVRAWVKAADYWGVKFALIEQVKLTFDAEGISIPYPQQDVHMHQVAGSATEP